MLNILLKIQRQWNQLNSIHFFSTYMLFLNRVSKLYWDLDNNKIILRYRILNVYFLVNSIGSDIFVDIHMILGETYLNLLISHCIDVDLH
jgi:hypothetical protein